MSARAMGALVAIALVATWAMARGDNSRARSASSSSSSSSSARLQAVAKTEGLLDSALDTREAQARVRLRALYKLSRAGDAPLWLDADARRRRVRWRGAARRIISRDLRELALFRQERRVAARARARLEGMAPPLELPEPGSLMAPVSGRIVAGPGIYRHRASRAKLARRGSLLASKRGQGVVAVADGVVVYAGPIRGLGQGVVVSHGSYHSVLGRLARVSVSAGDTCARGQRVGDANGERIYLEIRTQGAVGGAPIDPGPLLGR